MLVDDLIAQITARAITYDQAIAQYNASVGGPGMGDWHDVVNMADAATAVEKSIAYVPEYSNATTQQNIVTGVDTSGNVTTQTVTARVSIPDPYWTSGAGAAAILPELTAQAAAQAAAVAPSEGAPTNIVDNGNGTATAVFASGATHTVSGPDAVKILTDAYAGASPAVQYVHPQTAIQSVSTVLPAAVTFFGPAVGGNSMTILNSTGNASDQVTLDYRLYLGRDPTTADLEYWDGVINSGGSLAAVSASIRNSSEAKAHAATTGTTAAPSKSGGLAILGIAASIFASLKG